MLCQRTKNRSLGVIVSFPNFAAGGNPYPGQPLQINAEQYLTGGRQFGPWTAPNLAPTAAPIGPSGQKTFVQFKDALRLGKDPEGGSALLQVMPWALFKNFTDKDLHAIYEYLRAIPVKADNPNPGP